MTPLEIMRYKLRLLPNAQFVAVLDRLAPMFAAAKGERKEELRMTLAVAMAEHSRRIEEWLVDRFSQVPVGAMLAPHKIGEELARELGVPMSEAAPKVAEFMARKAA